MSIITCVSSGCVAQLVEQLTLNQWVQGSSPCASTRTQQPLLWLFCFGLDKAGREPKKGSERQLPRTSANEVRGLRSEWGPSWRRATDGDIQSLRVHQNTTATFVAVLFWSGQSRTRNLFIIDSDNVPTNSADAKQHLLYHQPSGYLPTT